MSHNPKLHFARHYVEMVVVMFAGMFVLGAPSNWVLGLFGTSTSDLSNTMMVFEMAVTMTVPMVAWMRWRGHAWRPSVEMAAAMFVPAFALMGLLWSGAVAGLGTSMVVEHAAMLAAMLAAMMQDRDEYVGAEHAARA